MNEWAALPGVFNQLRQYPLPGWCHERLAECSNMYLGLVEALIYHLSLKCQHTEYNKTVGQVKKCWDYWIKCQCLCKRWMCYDYFHAYSSTTHNHNLDFMKSSRIMVDHYDNHGDNIRFVGVIPPFNQQYIKY